MANKEIKKESIDKEVFLWVLKIKGCSIRQLGKEYEIIQRTERQIRRCLDSGRMPYELLDNISKYLNIDPMFLSGAMHREAYRQKDEIIREIIISGLKPEKYPYPYGAKTSGEYPQLFIALLNTYSISEKDFLKLQPTERVLFRQELDSAIMNVVAKYFEKDSEGKDTKELLAYFESMVGDTDPFSKYAEMEGIGLTEKD